MWPGQAKAAFGLFGSCVKLVDTLAARVSFNPRRTKRPFVPYMS
jgi:hypothetical protein